MEEKDKQTVAAFSEWMDKNMEGYLMFFTKDGKSGTIMNGDVEQVIIGLASGMIEHDDMRFIISQAMAVAANELFNRMPTVNADRSCLN